MPLDFGLPKNYHPKRVAGALSLPQLGNSMIDTTSLAAALSLPAALFDEKSRVERLPALKVFDETVLGMPETMDDLLSFASGMFPEIGSGPGFSSAAAATP